MPVDHFPLIVPPSAFDATVKFLIDSLGHLGFKEFWRPMPGVVGMGETDAYFWISSVSANGINEAALMKTLERTHIAFQAENAQQVRDFHAAALKADGIDNGPPGIREMYGPKYYGAFVRDPLLKVNWEVVCRNGDS